MILYHGTSTKHMDSILKNGLQPRTVTGNSNWSGKIESKSGFVYLSTAYPVYFAVAAAREDHEQLLVLQVEVAKRDLYPDEDFVAYALHESGIQKFARMKLQDIIPLVNLEVYKSFAEKSLKHNGLAAVKFVPPTKIKGHVVIDLHKNIQEVMSIGGDAIPSPIPYMVLGEHYRKCMKALFAGGLAAAMEVVAEHNRPFREMLKELDIKQKV
jgi:hypothetical protein